MIGRTLGHYEILAKLGQGGMGEVYRARDTRLGRDVALKLLPDSLSRDRERLARLSREAQILASLNHPNVATLHGLEESGELRYLVMELVPGETLAERLARGPLSIDECLSIFRQIAEALEAAHEKGIIHRDLKPANVIVTEDGRVKVLDFGLAKAVTGEKSSSDLSHSPTLTREGTEHGVILGTASYMSPEQARGKTLDRRTDIWSFGCVFYEALTGKKAFSGETVSDVIAAILEREPDWTALPARTPETIRALLRWCLEKEPRRRLRDIGDARIEVGEPEASPAPQRRYLPWVAAAAVAGTALGFLLRPVPEPERPVSRLTVNLPADQGLAWVHHPSVALSPDGERLVYVGRTGTERKLYVRPIDRLDGVFIPGTEGAVSAIFSPDGDWLLFYDGTWKLKKVRLDSGLPVPLGDVGDPGGASWGIGGAILFASGGKNQGLSRVSASGGAPSALTTPDSTKGEKYHAWPEVLPDGKAALFTIYSQDWEPQIGLVSLDTGSYRVLLEGASFARYVPTGHVLYLREGKILAAPFDLDRLEWTGEPVPILEGIWTRPPHRVGHFTLSRNGTLAYVPPLQPRSRLLWVDRAGSSRPLTETRREFEDPRFSPDGRRLSLTIREDGRPHIWVYEIERDSFARLTFGEGGESAVWTPDGKRLTYQRGDPSQLFWLPADGSGSEETLTTRRPHKLPTSWSPDGRELVYTELSEAGSADLWVFSIGAEPKERPLLEGAFHETGGMLSPDGRYLAYQSDESGRFEVYVRPFPGPGGKWPVSNEGGVQPVWARNGREIFYRNGDKLMSVKVETQPNFQAGRPAPLFEANFILPGVDFPQYDVTPDGQRFVLVQSEESFPTRIEVVLNWTEELKARVPVR